MTEPPRARAFVGLRRFAAKAAVAGVRASLKVSPRPMALGLRRQFAKSGGVRAAKQMQQAPVDIVVVIDERYDTHRDALLDVYIPASAARPEKRLPTVVWTHGGAFVGGSKDQMGGYLRRIADAGFTVAAIRYSLAPEERYPTPVRQVMAALAHLQASADRLHVDPSRFVLAGDSAGAHISAQVAAVLTNPDYSKQMGIKPTIGAEQLRGVALFCGVFDLRLLRGDSRYSEMLTAVGRSYSGTHDFLANEFFMTTMSVIDFVTEDFPRAFVTAGNADPLLPQSMALADELRAKGVTVDTLFYPDDHQPLSHEYQFELDLEEGRAALRRLIEFFERETRNDATD